MNSISGWWTRWLVNFDACIERAEEVDHRVATRRRVSATVVGDRRILGEALDDLVPPLLVDAAHVAVLQALDRLELDELREIHARVCQDQSGRRQSAHRGTEPA